MISLDSYLLFIVASVALILVPGPAQALVIATTLDRGPKQGVSTAVGLNVGTLFHAAAAGLGLSAILATSALAFSIVKYLGAAYLLYLGLEALRSKPSAEVAVKGGAFGQAVLTGILNPKVALFFLAFLPQFVDPARGAVMLQFLLLGLTMAALDTVYECALVNVTHRLRGRFAKSRRFETLRSRISGAVLVLLGVRLALQER